MGEYGQPDSLIPEGFFPDRSDWVINDGSELVFKGDLSGLPFPRQPGSFYHLSKAASSQMTNFACNTWGLKATDIMSGVVYGTCTKQTILSDKLATRFDIDESFGTLINRFVAQAILGVPITIHGKGSQKRGFATLEDTVQCLSLIVEDRSITDGQYRVFNQLEEVYSIIELANEVSGMAERFGIKTTIEHVENQRKEKEYHSYIVKSEGIRNLGYLPLSTLSQTIEEMFETLIPHRDRIVKFRSSIEAKTKWA